MTIQRSEAEVLQPTPPLGPALFRVMRAIMFEDRPVAELDALPLAQLRLLWSVHRSQGSTMKEYSERLQVSQSTVTQLAERLVRRGLVERTADTVDRRVVRLRTSSSGRELLAMSDSHRERKLQAVWDSLPPDARDMIMHGLQTLGDTAEKLRAEQGWPMPTWPEPTPGQSEERNLSDHPSEQSVVDLMARRVRGRHHKQNG